ncbi:MAG: hypothetical protein RIR31_192, partial [Bacteroidota bacterium]
MAKPFLICVNSCNPWQTLFDTVKTKKILKKLLTIFFISAQLLSYAQLFVKNNYKTPRTDFGAQKLQQIISRLQLNKKKYTVVIDKVSNQTKESFTITTKKDFATIAGSDESGILYGCL